MLKVFEILDAVDQSIGLDNLKRNCSFTFIPGHKVIKELIKRGLIEDKRRLYLYLDDKISNIEVGISTFDGTKWDFISNMIATIQYGEYKNYKRTQLIDKILKLST
jgi:hypothetical protein